jgi:hypothetical protein
MSSGHIPRWDFVANNRDTSSGERLPSLQQVIWRDRHLFLASAGLTADDYPVPIAAIHGIRPWSERDRCPDPGKHKLAKSLGRRDDKGIGTNNQPFWSP